MWFAQPPWRRAPPLGLGSPRLPSRGEFPAGGFQYLCPSPPTPNAQLCPRLASEDPGDSCVCFPPLTSLPELPREGPRRASPGEGSPKGRHCAAAHRGRASGRRQSGPISAPSFPGDPGQRPLPLPGQGFRIPRIMPLPSAPQRARASFAQVSGREGRDVRGLPPPPAVSAGAPGRRFPLPPESLSSWFRSFPSKNVTSSRNRAGRCKSDPAGPLAVLSLRREGADLHCASQRRGLWRDSRTADSPGDGFQAGF